MRTTHLNSGDITYNSSVATIDFQAADGPLLIVGIVPTATDEHMPWKNVVKEMSVQGVPAKQGDDFPLGFLCGLPLPRLETDGDPTEGTSRASLWEGDAIFYGGKNVGGVFVPPRHKVRIRLEDKTGDDSAQIDQLTLIAVELDSVPESQLKAIQRHCLVFYGTEKVYTANFTGDQEQAPKAHGGAEALMMLDVQGLAVATSGYAPAESDFKALNARIRTQTKNPRHSEEAPARAAIGYPTNRIPAEYNLAKDESALIRIVAPTPSASRTLYLVGCYQGRDQ